MSDISCTEFCWLLDLAVDAREPVDTPELRGHAGECADCRAAWLDALVIEQAVDAWCARSLSADLVDRVLARRAYDDGLDAWALDKLAPTVQPARTVERAAELAATFLERPFAAKPTARVAAVRSEPSRSRRTARALMVGGLSAAALIVVAFGRFGASPPRVVKVDGPSIAADAKPMASPGAPAASIPPAGSESRTADDEQFASLVRDAGSACLNLASGAAEAVTASTALVPPAPPDSTATRAGGAQSGWVYEFGRELQPVRRHLSQAFEFLFEAVPDVGAPAT